MVVHALCHGPRCIGSRSIVHACPKAVLRHLGSGSADSVLFLEIPPPLTLLVYGLPFQGLHRCANRIS